MELGCSCTTLGWGACEYPQPTTPHEAGGLRGVAGVAREPMRGTKWVQGTAIRDGTRAWTWAEHEREDGAGGGWEGWVGFSGFLNVHLLALSRC